ncbi:MAG: trigger factor [Gammaproteobacteria bacterium]|nr:trigger factor [Gammaproteobacteria bacterium]
MQVSVETTNGLERRMTVAIPADRLESLVSDRLKRLSREVRMPGFRPGKVPLKVVEAKFGASVVQEAAGELIRSSLAEALGREGLQPAGGPQVEPRTVARGQDLEYTAVFEVMPQFSASDIAGARIERPSAKVEETDIDRTLETMRQQRMVFEPVERAAATGDRVKMDFTGRLEGEAFEGGSATDFTVVVGSGRLVEDFDRQLAGRKAGEQAQLDVAFPADYPGTELAGRTVQFEVHITEVAEGKLPEISEDFARALGVEDGNISTLRAEIRSNLSRELEDRVRAQTRDRVMDALLERHPIDVPRAMIDGEIDNLMKFSQAMFAGRQAPTDRSLFEEQARRRVSLGLIMSEMARSNDIRPDQERIQQTLERMAESYDKPDEFKKWQMSDDRRRNEIEAMTLEEMLVEHLLAGAEVVDVSTTFQEVMYPNNEESNQP